MKREAFAMKLKPGCAAEYHRRHDLIWPELVRKHTEYGVRDYSIFLDEKTLTLFAFRRVADGSSPERMREDELVRRWWDYNADLMECKPDHEPVCVPLDEVFHMD